MSETTIEERRTLDGLADQIRAHHKAVERHAQAMLDEAIAAGGLLLEAKGQLGHGEFGPFVAFCGVSDRSARVYMRLARHSGSAAVLEADSIRAALDALAGRRRKRPAVPYFGPPRARPSQMRETARWLEAMAAQGRDADDLARHFDNAGNAKEAFPEGEAKGRSKSAFVCPVCGGWHVGTGMTMWRHEHEVEMGRRVDPHTNGAASLTRPAPGAKELRSVAQQDSP